MPKYCKHCGNVLPEDAHFCPFCGKQIEPKDESKSSVRSDSDAAQISSSKNTKPKNSKNLNIPLILLIVAIIAAGLLITYNHFSSRSNALIPQDTIEDADSMVIDFDEEGSNPIEDAEDSEAALRKRIQNIYIDVLKMNPNANYAGRYCTTVFNNLIHAAAGADMMWIDFDYWIFAQDFNKPVIEQMKVMSYSEESATVKVAIRPIYEGQGVNIITLKMLHEDGAWLIDDFQCSGISIKTLARHTIEEAEIQKEISENTEDSIQ